LRNCPYNQQITIKIEQIFYKKREEREEHQPHGVGSKNRPQITPQSSFENQVKMGVLTLFLVNYNEMVKMI
jgi:hypothetical protein